ncbi:MAG: hypothetical protein A4C66_10605 [Nitrospira sp. HN-bin3]|nr:MAG: hypothetical protein A4C66_10605 [Nitrospira sp. HN-bin3]
MGLVDPPGAKDPPVGAYDQHIMRLVEQVTALTGSPDVALELFKTSIYALHAEEHDAEIVWLLRELLNGEIRDRC